MLIIWGTKIVRTPVGRVADFCAVCRQPRPFKLVGVRKVDHIYYVPIGKRKLVGHEMACEECTTTVATNVAT